MRNVLIAIGASVLDFIVAAVVTMIGSNMDKDLSGVIFGICIVIAVLTYLICGGLKIALSVVVKTFGIGMMIPLFPINLVIALILVANIGAIAIFLPVVVVLIDMHIKKKNADNQEEVASEAN